MNTIQAYEGGKSRPVEKQTKGKRKIMVEISRRKLHPRYKKYITRSKKIMAHDEHEECQVGDIIRVVETRPLSKVKRWRLLEVVEKEK